MLAGGGSMRALLGARRWPCWLRTVLAVGVVVGTLASVVPAGAANTEPPMQGLATPTPAPTVNPCQVIAPPLVQQYVDVPNGFALNYPDRWIFRSRSGALPGARSDVVWFGPDHAAGGTALACLFSLRVAMHYFRTDTSLEEMRDATAMLELPSLISRALQTDIA